MMEAAGTLTVILLAELPSQVNIVLHLHADSIAAVREHKTGDLVRKRTLIRADVDSADRGPARIYGSFSRAAFRTA